MALKISHNKISFEHAYEGEVGFEHFFEFA
jgi:hypothetical protein